MGKRLIVIVAIVAALALLVVPASASAHRYSTVVSVDGFNDHFYGTRHAGAGQPAGARGTLQGYDFFGHLESNKRKCRKAGRRVNLFLVREGNDKRLGFDLSDSNGGWSVFDRDTAPPSGTYLSKLKPKKIGKDICKGDTATFGIVRPRP
jgi:hypothetical protein